MRALVAAEGLLVSAGTDGRIRGWRLRAPEAPQVVVGRHGAGVTSIALTPAGELVTAGHDGHVLSWGPGTHAPPTAAPRCSAGTTVASRLSPPRRPVRWSRRAGTGGSSAGDRATTARLSSCGSAGANGVHATGAGVLDGGDLARCGSDGRVELVEAARLVA